MLASPGPASELTESLLPDIADRLAAQLPGARWKVEFVSDRLVEPHDVRQEEAVAGRNQQGAQQLLDCLLATAGSGQ